MAEYTNLSSAASTDAASDQRGLSLPSTGQRRKSSMGYFNRVVLCAIDPNPHSMDAFGWFLTNVWRTDDLLILVYCPETPNFPSISFKKGLTPPIDLWKQILDDMNAKTRRLEEEYEAVCVEKKLKYKMRLEAFKNPGEGICKIAGEEKADLIMLGSRGLGAVKRAFLGSVSEYVTRNAGVPCLVVPTK